MTKSTYLESPFLKKYPLIFKKYRTLKKIAKGAFSEIYSGVNIHNNEKIAFKIENRNKLNKYLESECYTLFSLRNIGIPKVLSFGHNKEYDILIMPLLGKSLLDLFISKNANYEFKDICLIAIQIIDRIQWVHSRKIIHRDIKPDNFLIGLDDPHIIYLIDFGLSKKYQSTKTGKHIKLCEVKKFTGSIIYGSINSLRFREQSRRDDLESIGYMLIHLMKGSLPWQRVKVDNKKESYLKVAQLKYYIKPEKLCENLPNEFVDYIKYVKQLKFEEDPNYAYLRNLFIQMMKKQGFEEGFCLFSWINLNNINLRNIKRQINLSRRSCSRKRIINKIKRTLESSEKSHSEIKNNYYLNRSSNNNDIFIFNEKKNFNFFNYNANTKIKKYINQKKFYFNTDINNFRYNYSNENNIENNNNNLKNSVKGNNNYITNSNILKINNCYSPFISNKGETKQINNYLLTDNNTNNIKVNSNYNNFKNPDIMGRNIKNNNTIKINPYKNKSLLIENNKPHKRVSSNYNIENKNNNFIDKKTFNKNNISNNNLLMNKRKNNIIIINNNIYPFVYDLSYNHTIDNDRQNEKKYNKYLSKFKLFNIFTPNRKKQSYTIQTIEANKGKIKKNNELMGEINMFNKRYNNEKIIVNKSAYENGAKKIKVPKINYIVRSCDYKKGCINKVKKNNNLSPNNKNCNIF